MHLSLEIDEAVPESQLSKSSRNQSWIAILRWQQLYVFIDSGDIDTKHRFILFQEVFTKPAVIVPTVISSSWHTHGRSLTERMTHGAKVFLLRSGSNLLEARVEEHQHWSLHNRQHFNDSEHIKTQFPLNFSPQNTNLQRHAVQMVLTGFQSR